MEAAAGIVDIVNENMAAAFRVKTIERGLDPREFLLCAFGGAGPLQAVELARLLGIPEVVIPPNPGVTSAAGLLASDLRYDAVRSVLQRLGDVDAIALRAAYEEHEQPFGRCSSRTAARTTRSRSRGRRIFGTEARATS